MADLLCGHWTFFLLNDGWHTARCDLEAGHRDRLHRYWWNPATHESFSWADAYENHDSSVFLRVGSSAVEQGAFNSEVEGSIPSRPIPNDVAEAIAAARSVYLGYTCPEDPMDVDERLERLRVALDALPAPHPVSRNVTE